MQWSPPAPASRAASQGGHSWMSQLESTLSTPAWGPASRCSVPCTLSVAACWLFDLWVQTMTFSKPGVSPCWRAVSSYDKQGRLSEPPSQEDQDRSPSETFLLRPPVQRCSRGNLCHQAWWPSGSTAMTWGLPRCWPHYHCPCPWLFVSCFFPSCDTREW